MQTRTKQQGRHIILLAATLLIMILYTVPLRAQEATPETSDDVATTEIAIPTDITPTEVMPPVATEAPVEPTVEATAPVEPSEVPLEMASDVPSETETPSEIPSATPSETPTAEPVFEPVQAYSTNFDAGFPVELGSGNGWLPVTLDAGQAIQYSDSADVALYILSTFTDSAIEAKILLNSGDVTLTLRKTATGEYRVILSADVTLTLYRNGELVNTGAVTLIPGAWITLKFSVVGGVLHALVDGVEIVNATDLAPLPSGQAGFAASAGALLRLDDVVIYGIGDGVPILETPEATLEPTVEITPEATAELAATPLKSRRYSPSAQPV